MSWRGALLRTVNRSLLPFDLQIKRQGPDFDARLLSARHHDRMIDRLASIIAPYLKQDMLFGCRNTIDCHAEIERFMTDYLGLEHRSQGGGSRFINLLWLYLLARVRQPASIVESGTYRGLSAWALHKGAPDARLITFDIDPASLMLRLPEVEYVNTDWCGYEFDIDPTKTLLFFDDHVDQARRVREAHARGFRELMFDDDAPLHSFARRTGHAGALPKISFVFDGALSDGEMIEWQALGKRCSYRVDRAYLDETRLLIRERQRLPDLSWDAPTKAQLPMTLVLLEPGQG